MLEALCVPASDLMNNDARFFFCLTGFIGFVLFFCLGWLLTGNALDAVVRGSIGCLIFAIGGRIFLGAILRSLPVDLASDSADSSGKESSVNPSQKSLSPEEIAIQASAEATSEAAAGVEPGVNTTA